MANRAANRRDPSLGAVRDSNHHPTHTTGSNWPRGPPTRGHPFKAAASKLLPPFMLTCAIVMTSCVIRYSMAQLEPAAVAEFANTSGWPDIMVEDLLGVPDGVLPRLFAKEHGNQAQDLLILGFSDYMDVVDDLLYDSFLLLDNSTRGGSSSVATGMGASTSNTAGVAAPSFDQQYDQFAASLLEQLNAVTNKYGRLRQLQRWRASLNLPDISDDVLCRGPDGIEDPECPVVSLGNGPGNTVGPGVIAGAAVSAACFLLLLGSVYFIRQEKHNSQQLAKQLAYANDAVKQEVKRMYGERKTGKPFLPRICSRTLMGVLRFAPPR